VEAKIGATTLSLVRGDITAEETDAIVNAANSNLSGGGGVDGAIHRAGGPSIMQECRKIGSCPAGSAVVTSGGRLKARYVIHTVGPIYRDGTHGEAKTLASAYRESLKKAVENGVNTLAFPSISTGVYGYPVQDAASTALAAVIEFIRENSGLDLVRFVLFSDSDLQAYCGALKKLIP